jgi:hypothetical protein
MASQLIKIFTNFQMFATFLQFLLKLSSPGTTPSSYSHYAPTKLGVNVLVVVVFVFVVAAATLFPLRSSHTTISTSSSKVMD